MQTQPTKLPDLEAIIKPTRDIVQASKTLDIKEIRFMVDAYYQMQEYRKATANQIGSIERGADADAPDTHDMLDWTLVQVGTMEKQIARALDVFSASHEIGDWLRGIYGIGPVIAAGLLAHIDIEKCPTVGHIWRFAGLDPTLKWEKGKKRPFNASLKTLCWKIGQSFMKFSGQDECYYGKIYRERKQYEIDRNEIGGNKAAAAAKVTTVGKATEAFKHYSDGKLPPAQIDARARRYAVKMFLSHLHQVWYTEHFGEEPPKPFAVSHLGHAHILPPPLRRAA